MASAAYSTLTCTAAEVPPLQMQPDTVVYTDGSKQGTSITAALVHPVSSTSAAMVVPGPSSAQRPPVRGELSASHSVAHAAEPPSARPLDLLTDSLTSLQMLAAHLVRPTHHLHHKHRWLISSLAQRLLYRPAPVRLMKVRAHIGVHGNEAADRLAAAAHDDASAPLYAFTDPVDRGLAWVQYCFGESLSVLDTLHGHALRVVTAAHSPATLAQAPSKQSKTLLKVQAAHNGMWTIEYTSSNAFWSAHSITDRQRSLALQVRYGTLLTRTRVSSWYPDLALPE
ncbi:hypothetical protein MMC29_003199 [Sticta canariensis]|nr:hypothetical protein [Sticta canariensis]